MRPSSRRRKRRRGPRPNRCARRNAARPATKTKTKTPQRSPVRHRGDKDEAEQLRKEVARLTRENFSLAARLSAQAAAPAPADDKNAPLPPPPMPKAPARRYSVGAPSRFSLDSRLPAARWASLALVRPASKPPCAEATTPALEFVAVYGAFDKGGEGAAGSMMLRGAYAARPRELFGWDALPQSARRALPAFCCPNGVPLELMTRGAAEAYACSAPRARVVVLAGDDAPLYLATVAVKCVERVAAALVRAQIQTAVAGADAPPPPPLGDDVCVVGERTFAAATRCPPGRAVLAFLEALARDDDAVFELPPDAVFDAPAQLERAVEKAATDAALWRRLGAESPRTTPATMAAAAIMAAVARVDAATLARALALLLGEASLVVVARDGAAAGDVALGLVELLHPLR